MSPELEATAGQWVYVSCHCMVNLGSGIAFSRECDACHNKNIRYMHTLRHEDDGRFLEVGIECARTLVDESDAEIPRLAENETKRKETWRIHYHRPGRCITTVDNLISRGKL